MGLGLRMGRQRHRHQREQQFRPQQQHQEHQRQRQPRRQLATSGRTIRGTEAARRTANRATADRFGGTARGDSLASRQSGARTQQAGDRRERRRAPGVRLEGRRQAAAPAAAATQAPGAAAAAAVETESAIERFREAPGQEAAAPSAAAPGRQSRQGEQQPRLSAAPERSRGGGGRRR